MPKPSKGEELRQVERKVERAKDNLLVIQYDIPRAEIALKKATAAKRKAENGLNRLRKRQETLRNRAEQYEAKLESLREILGDDDGER